MAFGLADRMKNTENKNRFCGDLRSAAQIQAEGSNRPSAWLIKSMRQNPPWI